MSKATLCLSATVVSALCNWAINFKYEFSRGSYMHKVQEFDSDCFSIFTLFLGGSSLLTMAKLASDNRANLKEIHRPTSTMCNWTAVLLFCYACYLNTLTFFKDYYALHTEASSSEVEDSGQSFLLRLMYYGFYVASLGILGLTILAVLGLLFIFSMVLWEDRWD